MTGGCWCSAGKRIKTKRHNKGWSQFYLIYGLRVIAWKIGTPQDLGQSHASKENLWDVIVRNSLKTGGHNWGRLLEQEKGRKAELQERKIAGEKGRFEGGRSRWQRGANIWAAIEKNRWRRRVNSWATEQLKNRWALIRWLQETESKEMTLPVRDRITLQKLAEEGWDFIYRLLWRRLKFRGVVSVWRSRALSEGNCWE